jgi:predicted RNase H-like nuclease
MFDDAAPIWLFKERLDAIEDPEQARWAEAGLFLIEVFPALALTTLASSHFGRLLGPRYNPARRKTFRQLDWISVADAVARHAAAEQIVGMEEWAARAKSSAKPRKSDHDMLDSVLCALIGYWWLFKPPANGPA